MSENASPSNSRKTAIGNGDSSKTNCNSKSPISQLSRQTSTTESDDDSGSAAFVDVGQMYPFTTDKTTKINREGNILDI